MSAKKRVPKLRFRGFSGEWEEKELSSICSMNARIGWQNLRTSEFLDSGDYYLITGTDFENGRVNFNTCHYVEKYRYTQDKKIQVTNGNILITKDGTLGKVAYVDNIDKPATLNAGVFNVRTKSKNIDKKYIFQYLKAPFLMNYVDEKATGGTIKHLNQNILVNFPVKIPDINEQTKIGNYFQNLDKLIEQKEKKHQKLGQLKKAILEKMFPKEGATTPEIRFKGFSGEWEEKKLNEICIYKTSSLSYNDNTSTGQYKLYDANKVIGFTNSNIQKNDYITIIKDGSGVGRVRLLPANTAFIGTMGAFHSNEASNIYFLFCCLIKTDFTKYITGATIPHIYFSNYGESYYYVPTKDEQTKIGNYFQKLDYLIELQDQELQKLKNIKKASLAKMFV